MLNILVNGLNGQMGQALKRVAPQYSDRMTISCGVDPSGNNGTPVVYPDFSSVNSACDLVIDFSIPSATMQALSFCLERNIPIVICTTGLSEDQIERMQAASKAIPVFRSGNMSLGINLMRALCKEAASILGDTYDIEIVETHHNRKIDAPSGTAKMLADAIQSVSEESYELVYGRHDNNHRREKREIGIHSLRGGTVVGEHEVLFMGNNEVLSLKHQSLSKDVFANGALRAAWFLSKQQPGLYDMDDLVKSILSK